MSAPPLRELQQLVSPAWLVGGAVRDELLGRRSIDFDVVVDRDARRLARDLGRAVDAHSFRLSEAFGTWRVIARDRSWQVDLMPLVGGSLAADLARRDLTINAIARELDGGELIDPHGGVHDLRERQLRMVTREAFRDDPLRVLRLVRLAAELDFALESETTAEAISAAHALAAVAAERVFAELRQIVGGPRPSLGLKVMEASGATAAVLPELLTLRGIVQSDYHHLDVHDHTLEVLERTVALVDDPGSVFPAVADRLAVLLAEPLADGLTRGQALRFGALFHDLAKAGTREVSAEGRVSFIGHDAASAEEASSVLSRLRASERLVAHVAALARQHLRLGFLVHETPLTPHHVYRYLRACQPVAVDVTLLSVADRLATRGRNSERAIRRHLELAAQILPEALRWHADPARAPVRGDVLARALEIRPGPELGRLLEELTEAAFCGEVTGAEQAVEWARAHRGQRSSR